MWESFEIYLQKKMKKLLLKPFKYWRAYNLGIIDADGKKIREPASPTEKQLYNVFDELVRRIKTLFLKYVPNKGVARYQVFREFLKGGFIEVLDEEIWYQQKQVVTEEQFDFVETVVLNWLRNHKFEVK